MSCKDCGDIDVPLPTERNGNASLPFVEVRNNRGMKLAREILKDKKKISATGNVTRRGC